MFIRSTLKQEHISRDTALAIYRLVITDLRGTDELRAQEPLTVEDGANVWTIAGSRVRKPLGDASVPGPIKMSISKLDGAIVSLTE